MKELLHSIEVSKTPIRFAYFDLGGVVFNFSGGLEQISQDIHIPFEEIVAYWRSLDNQICLGDLTPQDFWEKLVDHFQVGDPS